MHNAQLARTSWIVAGVVATLACAALAPACGGTVVFEEDGSGGGRSSSNGSRSNGSHGSESSTPNAGTAGPGGVGGADTGPTSGQSSEGVGGPNCVLTEQTQEYCYKGFSCRASLLESECEVTDGKPGTCWCFDSGAYVGQCTQEENFCHVGALTDEDCCNAFWNAE